MDDGTIFLIGGAALLSLLVVAGVIAVRRERERIRRIGAWAARHGWSFVKNPSVGWAARLPGRNGRVSLLVHGAVRGYGVGVAEYSYTEKRTSYEPHRTTGGSAFRTSTTTYSYLVTVVSTPRSYPAVAVARRRALSRLGRVMFGDGTAAIRHPEFDRQFRVATRDPAAARALLGPALVAEQLSGRLPEWSLAGHEILAWRQNGSVTDPARIPALTAPLLRVAELLGR